MRKDVDLVGGLMNANKGDTLRNKVRHTTVRPNRNEEEDDMLAAGVLPLGSGRVRYKRWIVVDRKKKGWKSIFIFPRNGRTRLFPPPRQIDISHSTS